MKPNMVIVDIQGFKDSDNRFIVKELAIATKEYTQTFLIKPPFPYHKLNKEEKKHVNWLEKERGILWREGFINYGEFKTNIQNILSNKNVIVKGEEKIKWLSELCSNCVIIDFGSKGCPKFLKLYTKFDTAENNFNCLFHAKCCALKNVICLRKWYVENNLHLFNLF